MGLACYYQSRSPESQAFRTALNAEVQKLIAMIHQNPLEPEIEKAEKAFSSFHADLAKDPWLPEKREIQEEFKKYRDELTRVRPTGSTDTDRR
uniref:Uncharacterized protein n=1 Tax=Globodera rostochiensis TaxID=31243 RepID=A0A914HWT9_GLORO